MRKLDRYIVSTVSASMILVLLVVLSLDAVFSFIAELEDLKNDYQLPQAFLYILTTMPRRIHDYMPLGAFIGVLIGLGSLASTSELTVMRAAGVSLRRLTWSALKPALILVFIALLIGEYVAPYFEKIAEGNRAVAISGEDALGSRYGYWHREGNTFMYFNAVEPNGVLHGVTRFEFNDERKLVRSSYARRALYQESHWLLEDLVVTEIHDTHTVRQRHLQQRWDNEITPSVLAVLIVKPENLSISGLFHYANYLEEQGLSAARYELAFWKKLLQPVATAVMVIVAISFVFGPLRSVTMGFRVFVGIIAGLIFKYLQDLLGPSSLVFGFDPIVATLVPITLATLLGAYLIRRAG